MNHRREGQTRPGMAELSLLFLALNLADVVLTAWLLCRGGIELNPLLACLADWPAVKMALAASAALFVVLWGRPQVLLGLVVGMSVVVAWNLAMAGVALW
jgi:hypothetical protein